MAARPKIMIIYYSMFNHIRQLAHAEKKGIEAAGGVCMIYQVPETLSDDILGKMHAAPKGDDPVLTHDMLHLLKECDGVLFGIPTRFGSMPAQMKAFFDSTGQMWVKGELVGKAAGIFTCVASQGGGQETTALTTITQLVHHGMIFVPTGYSFGKEMFDLDGVHGGTPYGAGSFAAPDGSRQPSKMELNYAEHQGKYFTDVVSKLCGLQARV